MLAGCSPAGDPCGESGLAVRCHGVLPRSVLPLPLLGWHSPRPVQQLLLLPNHPSPSDAVSEPMVPEWQKPRLVEDGSQRPLHLPVIHQLGCAQAGVVQGEAEALVKDLVHPG